MSRIENRPVSGAGAQPVLYQDVAQLQALKTALDRKPAAGSGKDVSGARAAREKFFGKPADVGLLLSLPTLPLTVTARPNAKELADTLRGLVQGHPAPRAESEAERRLLVVLQDLSRAQEGLVARLAKLTKA